MRLRRSIAGFVSVLALSFTAVLAGALTAQAADQSARRDAQAAPTIIPIGPGYGSCPQWRFCFWIDLNAQSDGYGLGGTLPCGANFELNGGYRNNIDSIMNRTSATMYLYDAAGRAFKSGQTDNDGRRGTFARVQDKVARMRFVCT